MKKLEDIRVLPVLESLEFIQENNASVVRFGDGEIDLILGHSIPYQAYDKELAGALKAILQMPSNEQLLVCLPDVFQNLERYNSNARYFWSKHFEQYRAFYEEECQSEWYGSTFLSRPYIDLVDKSHSDRYFAAIKKLWSGRDILIVEGETSRSGMGNDLFEQANSVSRIICPSKNAFSSYDRIISSILRHAEGRLVILMLGPTAKLLSYDLTKRGYQAIDLGHIDSEYEWFQMKAESKVKLEHKHTAEFNYDENIAEVVDEEYINQVLEWVDVPAKSLIHKEEEVMDQSLISVIVPVYNVKPYLARCLDSLLKQTHTNFELLLVNDGSKDGSAFILEEYAKKDSRIRVIHQENMGVSAARNRAIDEAKGSYITFIDSDDFVEDFYLEHLYQAAVASGSDIAATNFSSFNEERQSFLFYHTKESYFQKVYSVQEWMDLEGDMKNNMHLAFTFSPLKLFKRELFGDIRYPVGRLREDDATIYKLYLKANQIHFTNEGTYYYSQRAEGLSRTAMHDDIATMVSNAEERISLMVALGYNPAAQITSYVERLKKCRGDALYAGQINLYRTICSKIDLYEGYQKREG
ncbi:SP_1767 family glycosyltransferase [Streptococcus suis]|uniref:Putative glycosyltransferase (GalT1) n=2 Tax=Streptococcus suis TaxID=1307 RepID=A0A0Z8LIY5_STRSU|nr:SP_1767 family glycosyltransferase [Streptococcus suis]MCK3976006.1 SP_1767 family glycosyltransferase [Streptococcus suis]MDW8575120.1 SP_1767 family glycosyltransferase [Streptococcus suis]MDW8588579.1 SP_1767 family glycosyltransferase [Streptococcus suis]MDW8615106.1 SP_1767 family glycosyltransferase [Streptococcus suis]NQG70101.1 SP_1767 family glycosyltransferase [Streptococcus suis]